MVSLQGIARLVGALLIASSSGVQAGSRIFEPRLTTARGIADGQLEVQRDPVSGALDFVAVNTTTGHEAHHGLHKRYLVMDVSRDRAVELWPNGIIKTCYERVEHPINGYDRTTEEILRPLVEEAMELWRSRGLNWDKNMFKFDVVDDDEYCKESEANKKHRHEFLLIRYDPEGRIMDSSVGKVAQVTTPSTVAERSWFELGSRMTLSIGGQRDGNLWKAFFAHEIGHVLGLYHEQQNPDWWRLEHFGGEITNDAEPAFDETTFDCSELHDYEEFKTLFEEDERRLKGTKYLEAEARLRLRQACRDIDYARKSFTGFSASAFLPEFDFTLKNPKRTEPDYKSIMIYPSRMNGRLEPGNTKRNIVFKRWDGGEIKHNLVPSIDDIDGVKRLYGVKESGAGEKFKLWFGDKASAFYSAFRSVNKNNNCDPPAP
ncbi:hypothetical protein QBC34DRAFT_416308 [Podospora aff. communis PSN243]|uniref:Peptidase metallopeptidase domain-containing protein n=1 Tax=Podospora aff. communis PSN243 TaxID=3040156 RepID=A0AAV9G9U1_9PEZI|nr:hypothetical protein QBC34DRAFT_416308 [Podospora aff. communis PSN243]